MLTEGSGPADTCSKKSNILGGKIDPKWTQNSLNSAPNSVITSTPFVKSPVEIASNTAVYCLCT